MSYDNTFHVKGLFTFHFVASLLSWRLSVTGDRNNVISEMTPTKRRFIFVLPFPGNVRTDSFVTVQILLALPAHQDKDLCYLPDYCYESTVSYF